MHFGWHAPEIQREGFPILGGSPRPPVQILGSRLLWEVAPLSEISGGSKESSQTPRGKTTLTPPKAQGPRELCRFNRSGFNPNPHHAKHPQSSMAFKPADPPDRVPGWPSGVPTLRRFRGGTVFAAGRAPDGFQARWPTSTSVPEQKNRNDTRESDSGRCAGHLPVVWRKRRPSRIANARFGPHPDVGDCGVGCPGTGTGPAPIDLRFQCGDDGALAAFLFLECLIDAWRTPIGTLGNHEHGEGSFGIRAGTSSIFPGCRRESCIGSRTARLRVSRQDRRDVDEDGNGGGGAFY